jgi:peptide/nickel transport system substrate-binding protein
MKMRRTLIAAACAAMVTVLPAAAEPVRGGTLIAASDIEPASLDPIFGNAPSIDGNYYNLFYEKLFYFDAENVLQPQLATGWEVAEDGLSIIFTLREGVTFHDGTPFDGAAVKASLERVIDPEVNAPHRNDLAAVSGVEVLSPTEVRVNLSRQSGAVLSGLANEAGMIVSPAAIKAGTLAREPVGTGPFRFVEWRSGDRVIAEANPDYWGRDTRGEELPYLDRVEIRVIASTPVKVLEALSGSVHLVDTVQVQDFAQIEQAEGLVLLEKPTSIHQWMAFNVARPPFDNHDLRMAFLHAIDRAALEQVVSQGYGVVTPTLVHPSEPIFDETLVHPAFDPERAREMLASTGFDGTVTISVIQRDPDTQIAQIMQSMLGQVGFNVEIEVLERGAWVEKVQAGNHEVGLLRINVPRVDPSLVFSLQMGRNAGLNFARYDDPAFFDLVDAAEAEINLDRRRELYVDVQRQLLDVAAYGFLFHRPIRDVATDRLNGLRREGSGTWVLSETWLDQ